MAAAPNARRTMIRLIESFDVGDPLSVQWHHQLMDHREAGRYLEGNALAWTLLSRQGWDVYRDAVNLPAFIEPLQDVAGKKDWTPVVGKATIPGVSPRAGRI